MRQLEQYRGIQWFRRFYQNGWLPLLLGIVVSLVVLGLWQQLLIQERLHVQDLVQQEANAVEIELNRELTSRIMALEQMANRWQASGGTPEALWQADADHLIQHFYGYQAIEWVDPSLHARWVIPRRGNEAAQDLDLSQESRRKVTLDVAHDLRQTILTRTISLAQGGKGFLAVVPLFVEAHANGMTGDRFDGFIVGVFRFQQFFDSVLKPSSQYKVQIYDSAGLLYSQGPILPKTQPQTAIAQAYNADWQVQVFPTLQLISEGRSLLPSLVLWGGLAGAWMLSFTVYLGQRSERQARRVRQINHHLQNEILERKQSELALQESEAKYRQLINHMHAGFVVHAPDTQILQCNPIACNLLGLSMEQMLSQVAIEPTWYFVREDGTRMPVEEYPVNRVLATQVPLENYVLGINRGTLSRIWVLVNAFPEFDIEHQLKQVVVTFINISSLKQAETNLRELTKVLENAVSGISKLDAQGYYRYVNKAYADTTGYQPEEMIGMPWYKTVHPDDLELMRNAYQQMLKTGKVEVEAKGLRKDGSSFYKQLVMIALYNEQQQFTGHYCFVKDISDRKVAEAILQQSESTLRSFFNNEAMLMGIVELRGHDILHLSANQTAANFFGMTPETMQNRFVSEMGVPQAYLQQWINAYREAEQTQVPIRFEYPHETPTSKRWLAASVCQIDNSSNQYPRFSYVIEDITERKQTEFALEKELMRSKILFNTSIDGIVVLNHQGNVIQSSPSFAQMIGYSVEETLALNVADWDAQWTEDELQQIREGHIIIPAVFETRHRRKDGSFYDAEISYTRVTLDNEILHFCICRDISERQQIKAILSQFAAIVESSEDAIIGKSLEGNITSWNAGAEKIFGYTAAEIVGQPITVLTQESHLDEEKEFFTRIQQGEYIRPYDTKQCRKDGTLVDLSISISPIKNANGQVIGASTIARDISDRKRIEIEHHQAEIALRQSEATQKAIIQAIPDLLIRMNSDGSYIEFMSNSTFNIVNPALHRDNTNVCEILPSDLAQCRLHYTRQALQSNTIQLYEHEIVIEGRQCYEEVRIVPLKNDEVLVMVRDITDRQQAAIDLKQQKEILQTMFDHIPIMIALLDENRRIEFINPELQRILGWPLQDWQQRDVLLECYPNALDWQTVMQQILEADSQWQDYITCTAHGQKLYTSWANVKLSNGYRLAIGQDITERKQVELRLQKAMEAAEAANLAKSVFLANMSHELRTPLNVILGFTQVMAHDDSLTLSQQEDLQTIRRSGDHLLTLINDVLDLSKIEADHCTLDKAGFDLISLLHTLRTMMTERATSKRLQLTVDIDPDVPQFVIADAQKIRQILLNLLSNAIKFTKQGGVALRVTCKRDLQPFEEGGNGYNSSISLQFEVSDTGVGIAPDEQPMIFDAFMQAEAGKKVTSGTGLGLTISRKLLQLMHGTISVRSTPNVGSTFTVVIPVRPTSGIDIPLERRDRPVIGLAPGQPKRRILVADDQSENRLLLVRLLARLGLDVQEATTGQDAIRIWQAWQPDLTCMDICMPDIDGYEVTQQIRAMEQKQDKASIIIALTAQASQRDRTLALAAGCNDYMSKPFREETLFLKLREYLGLEYLYADADVAGDSQSIASSSAPDDAPDWLDPALIASLSKSWLDALENATILCDDREVITLIKQLPPELAQLAAHLTQLAYQFEFEQILKLIHSTSLP
ncbi:MAG: PAS domain S-box protein [Oculatellaceae cyanobacterium bins.114]|nr:PAS domain S-box protein [Oculatellaceae cyanobacterium bins.114]